MKTGRIEGIKECKFRGLSVLLLCSSLSFSALAHEGHDHPSKVWPPEPQGITNVIIHSDLEQEKSASRIASDDAKAMETNARNNPRVSNALGRKYIHVTKIDKPDKQNGKTINQLVFFSYDKNATVEVDLVDNVVQNVKSIPAKDYQPEITDEEATQAQDIARNYFLKNGVSSVSALKGYSILAYNTEGKGFYNSRVIYVSFHDNDDSPPEYVAWVDLKNNRVIKAREEQQ